MTFFVQTLCLLILFRVCLAEDDLYLFLPYTAPPPCPTNEMHKICLSNCSNCEQRGVCIVMDCKKSGCDCIPHFVRVTPGGPCEPVNKCPVPECGDNEIFRECGPICERCGTLNCRVLHCEHKCYCKEGYKRDFGGKCLPEEECPPKLRCSRDEEMRDSGPVDEYCMHAEFEEINNSTQNKTQCYCKEGFKRNAIGHCMHERFCSVVRCLNNEVYQPCPRKCNTTCRNYGDPDCVEDGHCYPGCFCPEGYVMNDFRFCVKLHQCPLGSNPYVPIAPPEVETTVPSSINSNVEEEIITTPASVSTSDITPSTPESYRSTLESDSSTSESDRNTEASEKLDAKEESVSESEEEESEFVPNVDIVSDIQVSETTKVVVSTSPAPRRRPSKRPRLSKSNARNQKTEQSTSAQTEKAKLLELEEDMDENE